MPHRPKAKIYQFPTNRQTAEAPTTETNKLEALKEALSSSKPVKPEPATRKRVPKEESTAPMQSNTIYVDGNGFANLGSVGSIHFHTTETPPKPTVLVQTGVGVITTEQKYQLQTLCNEIVKASAVRANPKTHSIVWGALKKYMKVSSYHEILAEDFEKAKSWMVKQRGTMRSMASAPKKIDGWRTSRITAIHARSKEMDIAEWRIEYMQKKFGKVSLKELADKELEAVYHAVMSKKPPESAN